MSKRGNYNHFFRRIKGTSTAVGVAKFQNSFQQNRENQEARWTWVNIYSRGKNLADWSPASTGHFPLINYRKINILRFGTAQQHWELFQSIPGVHRNCSGSRLDTSHQGLCDRPRHKHLAKFANLLNSINKQWWIFFHCSSFWSLEIQPREDNWKTNHRHDRTQKERWIGL